MEPALQLLTAFILVLGALALALWGVLLVNRAIDNRRQARLDKLREQWLLRLLPVLEGAASVASLPRVAEALQLEAILGLLRELLERFRGQYREQLRAILHHIGAEQYGLRLLRQRRQIARLRGCALLSWAGWEEVSHTALLEALSDPRPVVRVEAAYALALRGHPGTALTPLFRALETGSALQSDRTRDIVRMLAGGRGDEMAALLRQAAHDRPRVLLIEGLALCGDGRHTPLIAEHLQAKGARVRLAAVRALHQLADPLYIQAVTALATDTEPKVRKAVAEYTVSMCNSAEARNILYWLTHDADFDVQRTAIHGLARHGGPPWQRLQSQAGKEPLMESMIAEACESLARRSS